MHKPARYTVRPQHRCGFWLVAAAAHASSKKRLEGSFRFGLKRRESSAFAVFARASTIRHVMSVALRTTRAIPPSGYSLCVAMAPPPQLTAEALAQLAGCAPDLEERSQKLQLRSGSFWIALSQLLPRARFRPARPHRPGLSSAVSTFTKFCWLRAIHHQRSH